MWKVVAEWHLDEEVAEGGVVVMTLRGPAVTVQIEFERGEATLLEELGPLDAEAAADARDHDRPSVAAGLLLGERVFWSRERNRLVLAAGHADDEWELRLLVPDALLERMLVAARAAERGFEVD